MSGVQLLVACPYCLAGPGEACRLTGRLEPELGFCHIERTREALR